MTIQFDKVGFYYDSPEAGVFQNLSLELPRGVTSLAGQNGTGKSTFLLLAAGRLFPREGRVLLAGRDTRELRSEEERNALASFVYQNMEFETEEVLGDLFGYVLDQGAHGPEGAELLKELIEVFALEPVLSRPFHKISKGEMQKATIAFSLLYGSPLLFLDEPVFALEDYWKDRVLGYLQEYARKREVSLYYSIHELDLSRKYADNGILFFKDGGLACGPAEALFDRENVEAAYQVPMELLYKRERLFRDHLIRPAGKEELDRLQGTVKVVEE